MKQRATIHDWWYSKAHNCLIGRVEGHPNQMLFKAPLQRTSRVLKLDLENKQAITMNTVYTLGEPCAEH